MDFFKHQARAQRKTRLLILYLVLAIIGILGTLQVIFAFLFFRPLNDPIVFVNVSFGVAVVVVIGSAWRIDELSGGGRAVAAMLDGEPVYENTTDLNKRKLVKVVEEMALASGVPVPGIYLLPDRTINAFAAGYGPGDAVIGVTRGCIDQLERDELQGVIAHEFSHIVHGDMRLNIRLMGLLAGILSLSVAGRLLMRMKGAIRLPGSPLYVVGSIGVFFATLIKAAVNRQREFLADASAVQYTRNPGGLARALWKISVFQSRLSSPRAQEASHMFFSNGFGHSLIALFATHPPLVERMKAIDPSFDPSFLPALQSETAGTGAGTGERSEARRRRGFWIAVIPAVGIAWFFGYPLYRVFQSLRALEAKGRQDFPAPTPGTRVPGYFTREKLYSAYRREQNADGMLRMTELKFKEDPNNLSVKHQVAGLLLVTGRQIDRAGRLAKELYESNPKSLQNATLYAFSLHLQGESTKAAELLDSRRDLQNLSNDGASYYALILSACGRGDEARHILAGVKRELLLPELREALDRAVAPASAIPR